MCLKTLISTPHAPAAIGPYSQAVRSGNLIFTSGQIPLDPTTGQMVSGGIEAQTARVIANLEAVLKASGCTFANVIKTTVFLKDLADFAAMNALYEKAFAPAGVVAPARSTVQAAALPKGALVEIELIASAD